VSFLLLLLVSCCCSVGLSRLWLRVKVDKVFGNID
jgi:hypothetical protein